MLLKLSGNHATKPHRTVAVTDPTSNTVSRKMTILCRVDESLHVANQQFTSPTIFTSFHSYPFFCGLLDDGQPSRHGYHISTDVHVLQQLSSNVQMWPKSAMLWRREGRGRSPNRSLVPAWTLFAIALMLAAMLSASRGDSCNNNNNNFYLYSAIKYNRCNCSVALYNE